MREREKKLGSTTEKNPKKKCLFCIVYGDEFDLSTRFNGQEMYRRLIENKRILVSESFASECFNFKTLFNSQGLLI